MGKEEEEEEADEEEVVSGSLAGASAITIMTQGIWNGPLQIMDWVTDI